MVDVDAPIRCVFCGGSIEDVLTEVTTADGWAHGGCVDADATPADRAPTVAPEPTAPPAVRTADGPERVYEGDGDREAVRDLLSRRPAELSPMVQAASDAAARTELAALVRAYRRGKRAGRAEITVAPGEIGIEDAGCVQVVMPPAALVAYRRWLTGRDLHLYRIPGLSDGDLPTYAIGIGAERTGAAGGDGRG